MLGYVFKFPSFSRRGGKILAKSNFDGVVRSSFAYFSSIYRPKTTPTGRPRPTSSGHPSFKRMGSFNTILYFKTANHHYSHLLNRVVVALALGQFLVHNYLNFHCFQHKQEQYFRYRLLYYGHRLIVTSFL